MVLKAQPFAFKSNPLRMHHRQLWYSQFSRLNLNEESPVRIKTKASQIRKKSWRWKRTLKISIIWNHLLAKHPSEITQRKTTLTWIKMRRALGMKIFRHWQASSHFANWRTIAWLKVAIKFLSLIRSEVPWLQITWTRVHFRSRTTSQSSQI